MKKFYMFAAALGMAALSANADLHMYIDGEEVANGATVDITKYFEGDDASYEVDPHMTIEADEAGAFSGTVTLVKGYSVPEFDWSVGAQVSAMWCAFDGQCVPIDPGKSTSKSASLSAGKVEDMVFHIGGMYGFDEENIADVEIYAECTLEATFRGKDYSLTLVVDKTSGVNDITIDANAPAEYFDLQGRRVNNPSQGLYIVRQGNKVVKTIIK